MTTYEIIKLMAELHLRNPESRQIGAIDKLAKYDGDLRIFILPLGKEYWENSAKVIEKMGYPKIEPIFFELLVWFQDMNWPGAVIMENFLCNEVPKEVLAQNVEKALQEAKKTKDEEWIYFLGLLVERAGIQYLMK